MSDNKKCDRKSETEIISLNLDNLDVTELEHRLEMAVAEPLGPMADCYSNICGINK